MSDISPITESIRLYAKQLRVPSFAKYNEILRHAGGGMGYEGFLLELMKKNLKPDGKTSRNAGQEQQDFLFSRH